MIKAFNDHLLIELATSEWTTADESAEQDDPRAGTGIVVAVPDRKDVMYLSSYTWIADNSLASETFRDKVHAKMTEFKGKRVYFEKRAEIGNVIEDGDKKYATIKLSKIVGVADGTAS
ncbi:hypothetical protein H0X10_04650 [Candidatus Saccharibacteria bacterium]|nr:hypothetical protein [Candidatus Saccharibacteria bacterium]